MDITNFNLYLRWVRKSNILLTYTITHAYIFPKIRMIYCQIILTNAWAVDNRIFDLLRLIPLSFFSFGRLNLTTHIDLFESNLHVLLGKVICSIISYMINIWLYFIYNISMYHIFLLSYTKCKDQFRLLTLLNYIQ